MEKELSQIEQLIAKAKDSKHTDAILLLSEKKDDVAEITRSAFSQYEKDFWKEVSPELKKLMWLFCETIFQKCVSILADDHK